MLSVDEQLRLEKLVCPVTRRPLVREGDRLRTADGSGSYAMGGGVPILLEDPAAFGEFQDRADSAEGCDGLPPRLGGARRLARSIVTLGGDRRSAASRHAFREVIEDRPPDALCLSVGGGPGRAHPNLVNLNIGPFPNVEIVADAAALPYADGSVDAIYCEAVLEHLELPERAVREMHRTLEPGGEVFAVTPFLQQYHGHPHHYQNLTRLGHRRLFERAGFEVRADGVCVGPTVALSLLLASYARTYVPSGLLKRLAWFGVRALSLPLRPLDERINRREDAHVLASSTFVRARKGS